MKGQSNKSEQMTFEDLLSATFSAGFWDGRWPSDSPDGPKTEKCGLEVARVNRSPRRGKGKGKPTTDICGQSSTGSSASVNLQRRLASKLQAKMDSHGTPEYTLTWKDRVTPSGVRICALRASGRKTTRKSGKQGCGPTSWQKDSMQLATAGPTSFAILPSGLAGLLSGLPISDNACSGWPTPDTHQCGGAQNPLKRKEGNHGVRLQDAAIGILAGFPTPDHHHHGTSADPTAKVRPSGQKVQFNLQDAAQLAAGWATPSSETSGGTPEQHLDRKRKAVENGSSMGIVVSNLDMQAQLAGFATPTVGDQGKVKPYHDSPQPALAYQAHLVGWNSPSATDGEGHGLRTDGRPKLKGQAQLAGWCTPMSQDASRGSLPPRPQDTGVPLTQQVGLIGPTSDMFRAGTGKRGALNPAFSLWLMGLPSVWLMAAPLKARRGRNS